MKNANKPVVSRRAVLTSTTLHRIEIHDPNGHKRRISGSSPGTLLGNLDKFTRSHGIVAKFVERDEPGYLIAYYTPEDAKRIRKWWSLHQEGVAPK